MRVFVLVCKMVTHFSHCCTLLCEVSTVLPGTSQLASPRIWAQLCDFYWLMDVNKLATSRGLGSICTTLGLPYLAAGNHLSPCDQAGANFPQEERPHGVPSQPS